MELTSLLLFLSFIVFLVHCELFEYTKIQRDENNAIVELDATTSNTSILLFNITLSNSTDDNITDVENSTEYENLTTVIPEVTTLLPEADLVDSATLRARELGFEDYCTCDLKANSCDANCCCDEECSRKEKEAFSQCLPTSYKPADERYCYQEDVFLANNTDFMMKKRIDGLFCIVTDNLKDANVFPTIESLKTIDEFNSKVKTPQRNSWMSKVEDKIPLKRSNVHGSPVLAVNDDGSTYEFELPSSFLSSTCDGTEKILYMTDYEVFCEIPSHPNLENCEHHPVMDVEPLLKLKFLGELIPPEIPGEINATTVESTTETTTKASSVGNASMLPVNVTPTVSTITTISTATTRSVTNTTSPTTSNPTTPSKPLPDAAIVPNDTKSLKDTDQSQLVDLLNYKLVPVNYTICEYLPSLDFNYCTSKEVPKVCCQDGECKNVLQAIELKFLHNGTSGLVEVHANIFLTTINTAAKPFQQYFKVSFKWSGDNEIEIFKRSGTPGYITGKPVLLGRLLKNESIEDEAEGKSWIEMDKDPKNWLTLLATAHDLSCTRRVQVNFRENVRSGCLVSILANQITKNCKEVRENIVSFLLGPILRNFDDLQIGMYGDSNVNISEEWVPILFEENLQKIRNNDIDDSESDGECGNVITSFEIEIAYVYQGPFVNPQAKIVGAIIRGGPFRVLSPLCRKGFMCSRMTNEEKTLPIDVEISSSVIFIDVSKAAERRYPKPPAFDFKLPYDFFYPFLPSIASSNGCEHLMLFCLLLISTNLTQ